MMHTLPNNMIRQIAADARKRKYPYTLNGNPQRTENTLAKVIKGQMLTNNDKQLLANLNRTQLTYLTNALKHLLPLVTRNKTESRNRFNKIMGILKNLYGESLTAHRAKELTKIANYLHNNDYQVINAAKRKNSLRPK